jgi:hypothetical protein
MIDGRVRQLLGLMAVVLGTATLLVITMTMLGQGLPKAHRLEGAVQVQGTLDDTAARLAEVRRMPAWHLDITKVSPLEDGAGFWQARTRYDAEVGVHVRRPAGSTVVSLDLVKPSGDLEEQWFFALEPKDAGTRVEVVQVRIMEHAFFRFVAHSFVTQPVWEDQLRRLQHYLIP